MLRRSVMVLFFCSLAIAGGSMASAAYYVDVADLTAYSSPQAWAINDSGETTGRLSDAGTYKAYIWSKSGGVHFVSPLSGSTGMWSFAINNNHQITGYGMGTNTNPEFQYGQMIYIGATASSQRITPIDGTFGSGRGLAISDNGQVTGYSMHTGIDVQSYPIYYNGTTFVQLGGYNSGSAYAGQCNGINNSGQAVGAWGGVGTSGAVLWNTSVSTTTPVALPMYGTETNATPQDINNAGQIVGQGYNNAEALLWTTSGGAVTGGPYNLGGLGSGGVTAYGISDSGVVVGSSNWSGSGTHGFVWTPTNPNGATGTMTDLNSLPEVTATGYAVSSARSISAGGRILALTPTAGKYLVLTPWMPGDATLDGKVDTSDLSRVLTNYDKTSLTWADGDFNGDGTVDTSDLSRVLTNYDKSVGTSGPGAKAVPEPSVLALAVAGVFGLLACGWRKRR